jgi:hypothetical protein
MQTDNLLRMKTKTVPVPGRGSIHDSVGKSKKWGALPQTMTINGLFGASVGKAAHGLSVIRFYWP